MGRGARRGRRARRRGAGGRAGSNAPPPHTPTHARHTRAPPPRPRPPPPASAPRRVTLWGFTDAHIWVPGSGIYDAALAPKPAATRLAAFWRVTHNTSLAGLAPPPGASPESPVAWAGYYGRYAFEVEDGGGATRRGSFEVAPGGPRHIVVALP